MFTKIPSKTKCKLQSLSISSKDFMNCLHVELCSPSTKKSINNNNTKIIYKHHFTYPATSRSGPVLIGSLNTLLFSVNFLLQGILYQIFRPKPPKLLVLKVTYFFLGLFKFSLYLSYTGVEHSFYKTDWNYLAIYISMQSLFSFNAHGIFDGFFKNSPAGTWVITKHESQCSLM